MNKVKKSVSILLSLLMVLSLVTAVPFTAGAAENDDVLPLEICGDYEYSILDDDTAEISNYTGDATELEIPSSLNGHTVKIIGWYAFYGCTSLTSATIPDSVTSIDDNAFEDCTSLTSITIPNSVTRIGDWVFSGCTNLTSITISDSVTSIGYNAFDNTGYYNNSSNWEKGVLYIGDYLIKADSDTVSGEYIIKDGTKVIAESAFEACTSLTSVMIPGSVTIIGDYSFYECTSLTNVTIPDSVTSIGEDAFSYCTILTNIAVDTNNQYYSSLDGNLYNKDKTELIQYAIGKSNTDFTIPDSVTSIGALAFGGSTNLANITIPNSVTSIGDFAFCNCTSLTSVTIPDSVTRICDWVFSGCESLKSVTIGKGVTSIGFYAFNYCTSLTSVTIPDNVTIIGDNAFCNCTSLTSVTIGDGVTSIDVHALGYSFDYDNEEYVEVSGFTITGYTGTEAEKYAKHNGFKFVSLGKSPNATTITLKKSSGSVYVKGTTNIKATVKNGKGTTTYKSSNKKVAKVSKTGKITGLKKGTAKITVTNNGVKKTFKITVKNPKLSKKTVSVKKGKTVKVKIIGKIKGINNKYINTKHAKVTSKKSASTLKIKGLKKGKTTLKIKVSGVTLKLKVKVK